ncbi:hypothetical protein CVIRNUC_001173 [Coccomyxa viridis]|uniref:Uncharacterized protein n=1 Tax=Coccomyxa viridis TaxID=1274662 RepID=A0AAV1HSG1_9CHLO|nr:hypothetical protein CVIRNUC_001173 [Coccomyxa viridis]
MDYQGKVVWTMAAIAAIAGAVIVSGDMIYGTENVQVKQVISCIVVFWVVAVIRTYMTYVWGFGASKPVPGLQPQVVAADEDAEGHGGRAGMTAPRRRPRRET